MKAVSKISERNFDSALFCAKARRMRSEKNDEHKKMNEYRLEEGT